MSCKLVGDENCGTLQWETFLHLAKKLSQVTNDGWHMRRRSWRGTANAGKGRDETEAEDPSNVYLAKTQVRRDPLFANRVPEGPLRDDGNAAEELDTYAEDSVKEVDDPQIATTFESENLDQFLTYEYHIVYSISYSVPVLYFIIRRPDGSLLSLDEIWRRVPLTYQNQLGSQKWTMLTQQEHPILGRPFFMLHPCKTSSFMKDILSSFSSEGNERLNYLLTWLSSFGPLVHLEVLPNYVKTG